MTIRPNEPLESVLDTVEETVSHAEKPALAMVLKQFGHRALGPVLLLSGVVLLTPAGAVPGIAIIFGFLIATFTLQRILERRNVWLPTSVENLVLEPDHIEQVSVSVRPFAKRIDAWVVKRGVWASRPTTIRAVAVLCLLSCPILVLLDPIPFGMVLPALMYTSFGLGLMGRDGVFLGIGFTLAAIFYGAFIYLALLLGT